MNDLSSITCPHCGTEFAISDAIREHIQREEIEKISRQHTEELAKLKSDIRRAEEQELSLRKQKELLEERERKFELEKQRALDLERNKIREQTMKEADEATGLKIKEKDLLIERLNKQIEEARRTASQGSQQAQGEVQELDIESALRAAFPNDEIEPVAKGVSGADCMQTVRSPSGRTVCGRILWESKRTKTWGGDWIEKLKADLRQSGSDVAALVSDVLPKDTKEELVQIENVWVTRRSFMIPMASLLREVLQQVAYQKTAKAHQGRKADLVYEFITSSQFRQHISAIVEAYRDMYEQIGSERRSYEKMWKAREAQLLRIINATAHVYGTMQGHAGNNALPEVTGLSLPEPE